MRWKIFAWLLALLLLASVVTAWKVYDDTNREPNLLLGWLRHVQTHEVPLTFGQRRIGILATCVGIGASLALGGIALGSLFRQRRLRPGLGLGIVTVALALFGAPVWWRWIQEARRDPVYIENGRVFRSNRNDIDVLTTLYWFARRRKEALDEYQGKDLILGLLAYGVIDRGNRDNLAAFFPDDQEATIPPDDAYAELHAESLGKRDFGHLTGYVGPIVAISAAQDDDSPIPLMADVSTGKYAIIGFSDGSVRVLEPEDLGLQDGDPLDVGEDAISPILRRLSDRSGP